MKVNSDKIFLHHIVDAINKIEKYLKNRSFSDFAKKDMLFDAVVREIAIIGEAASNISDDTKEKNPQIPWREIVGMRNQAIHGYFELDLNLLWQTCQEDLKGLKKQILEIL